ncbi:oxygen-dependent protoporphyrinogen oxidase [Pullulanibacillus pueri]|uniref:Coproporphyrinogen III oxidase n=1 Tax=Pullulanibacillus pueri TaxID=1437324 RepID=A0A8J3EPV8_9BACL|nr:protoporphyrinogen oxidase [Pullulanibacillus pueri]MBM7683443.1 oxygen-dependent protoporphyrinogen oxidase [Pullulanibacillus pueri]GGH87420.1 protoporphyrinogen oxidase [Pullulanibacillus pueri]
MMNVAIVGGGITGLSSAFHVYRLAQEKGQKVKITLLEATNRVGGKVQTEKREGFVIERGPDSFLKRKPEGLELVDLLGLSDQLIENQTGRSYILKDDALHPIPEGSVMGVPTRIRTLLQSDLLSMDGKVRVLNDFFIPKLPDFEDMSVGEFFKQRLGVEVVDHIISPLLSGIYAGDIYKLSLKIALPQFIEIEKKYGSLIKGLSQTTPKKKTSQFATLTGGLSDFIEALKKSLEHSGVDIQTGVSVAAIEKEANSYELLLSTGQRLAADQVILAVPHRVTEKLLTQASYLHREDAAPDTSVATIAMVFNQDDVRMDKEGTGFVVSRLEDKAITASTWTHMKWGHAAPKGKAIIRCYVGKAGDDDIINQSDETLTKIALDNLSGIVSIKADPDFAIVSRWPLAMPQYPVGHSKWLEDVRAKLAVDYPHVYLAGASYDGVGLPDCIKQAKQLAEQIIQ